MDYKRPPFNIWLLTPTLQEVKTLRPVKVMDIYDNTGINFHEDGLYSVSTFGRVGSKERDSSFSYIDLRVSIFHPEYFRNLMALKGYYLDIISGKRRAIFDEKEKNFIISEDDRAQTGYDFFLQHWEKIVFQRTDSDLRDIRIQFIEKYKKQAMFRYHLVVPAGIRDIEITDDGRTREDDMNSYYRKLLSASFTISVVNEGVDKAVFDVPRWTMQRVANELYEDIILKMIKGKSGWIQRKWGSRRTINGTRNVFTAMDGSSADLDSPDAIEVTDTLIGFPQSLRGLLPFTIYGLKNSILGQTFAVEDNRVWLTNKKTLKQELVELSLDTIDYYGSRPGMEKLINRFYMRDARNKIIYIEGYYLGLIYVDDKHFRVFKDIEDLPSHLSRKNVHPLTLADLLYTATCQVYKERTGSVTRYPITGPGSIYPTLFKIRTTTVSFTKTPLDDTWQPIEDQVVYNFPDRDPNAIWFSSLTPNSTRIIPMGADFDGDTGNSPFYYTEEAERETKESFNKRTTFVSTRGGLITSPINDTITLVIANLTKSERRQRYGTDVTY